MSTLTVPGSGESHERGRPRAAKRRASRRKKIYVTFVGVLYCIVLAFLCLAALNSESNLLFLLFGIGAGSALINIVLAMRMVNDVEVERIAPNAVVAGRPFRLSYLVRNRRVWMRLWGIVVTETPTTPATIRFPHAAIPMLTPRQQQRLDLTANCPSRMRLTLPGVRIISRFPFGLFTCQVDLKMAQELYVYPTVGQMRNDPFKAGLASKSSRSQPSRRQEEETEFSGLREYREGDNFRWIHWRRSARQGELLVREMTPQRQTRLIVILDPWPGDTSASPHRKGQRQHLGNSSERTISAAATMICNGLEQGHLVGLICRSKTPLVISPAKGVAHRQRLLEELALIEPGSASVLNELVASVRWAAGWSARCVVLTKRVDLSHDQLARSLGGRTEAVRVLSPSNEGFMGLFDLEGPGVVNRRTR